MKNMHFLKIFIKSFVQFCLRILFVLHREISANALG